MDKESLRRFEDYYDAKWFPMHWYFRFHKKRFLESFEFLEKDHRKLKRSASGVRIEGTDVCHSGRTANPKRGRRHAHRQPDL